MNSRTLLCLVCVSSVALAQEDSAKSAVRLRSSHTVDVIAPGEKVETVLDRMRANSPRMERLRGEGRPEGARVRGPPGRGADGPGGRKEGRMRHAPGGGPPGAPRDGRNDGPPPPPDRPRRPR